MEDITEVNVHDNRVAFSRYFVYDHGLRERLAEIINNEGDIEEYLRTENVNTPWDEDVVLDQSISIYLLNRTIQDGDTIYNFDEFVDVQAARQ